MDQETIEYITAINSLLKAQGDMIEKLSGQVNRLLNEVHSLPDWGKKHVRYINKPELDYAIECFHKKQDNNKNKKESVIVSLTSFPKRMYDIKYTLYSLANQTLVPEHILLWLAEEEFPNHESDIAPSLLQVINRLGVEVKWCRNHRSYDKIIHTLKEFPDSIIVTADDDIFYPDNWLEILYLDYLQNGCVCAHRAHAVNLSEEGVVLPYNTWKMAGKDTTSFTNFFTGCGGVLYYPGCFDEDVLREDLFMDLCPCADDIWLWSMVVKKGNKIRIPADAINIVTYVNPERELGISGEYRLGAENVYQGKNDMQLLKVLQMYPNIISNILQGDD